MIRKTKFLCVWKFCRRNTTVPQASRRCLFIKTDAKRDVSVRRNALCITLNDVAFPTRLLYGVFPHRTRKNQTETTGVVILPA